METGRLSHNAATSNSQRANAPTKQPAAQWPPLRRPQPVPAGRPMRNSSRRIRGSNSHRRVMPQIDLRRRRPSAAVSPNRIRGTTGGSTTTTILSSSGLCAALSARCSGPMPMTIVSITCSGRMPTTASGRMHSTMSTRVSTAAKRRNIMRQTMSTPMLARQPRAPSTRRRLAPPGHRRRSPAARKSARVKRRG